MHQFARRRHNDTLSIRIRWHTHKLFSICNPVVLAELQYNNMFSVKNTCLPLLCILLFLPRLVAVSHNTNRSDRLCTASLLCGFRDKMLFVDQMDLFKGFLPVRGLVVV